MTTPPSSEPLDVGLRHNYAAVGDRWVEAEQATVQISGRQALPCAWRSNMTKTYCKAGVRVWAISHPLVCVHMMDDSLCTHGLSDWDGKERRKSPLEAKLNDAKKLGLRGGADCLWAVLSDHLSERFQLAFVHCAERLTEDLLSQGKAQLHLRRESRRRLNEQERRKSDRRKRVP